MTIQGLSGYSEVVGDPPKRFYTRVTWVSANCWLTVGDRSESRKTSKDTIIVLK